MQIFSQKCLYAWILKAPHFKNKLLINLNKGKWQTKQQIFLQSSYSKINIQVRGTPKIFQGVECKKKITPAVRRARASKIFSRSQAPKAVYPSRAPSAERPFFGSKQFSSQIIPTRVRGGEKPCWKSTKSDTTFCWVLTFPNIFWNIFLLILRKNCVRKWQRNLKFHSFLFKWSGKASYPDDFISFVR